MFEKITIKNSPHTFIVYTVWILQIQWYNSKAFILFIRRRDAPKCVTCRASPCTHVRSCRRDGTLKKATAVF